MKKISNIIDPTTRLVVLINMNKTPVKYELDTGLDITIISEEHVYILF